MSAFSAAARTSAAANEPETSGEASPRRIATLADGLADRVGRTVDEILHINRTTRLVSLNAQIEAARAGGATGAAFGVVAGAIQDLSGQTATVAEKMAAEAGGAISELQRISRLLATNVRGERLADLARMNVDLIDRNLFERTADVRWWATDSSLVDALSEPSPAAISHASRRLGVILSAYTVYHDIVLCDLSGTVVANGKADNYNSTGSSVASAQWFTEAMASRSGDDYGFQAVHASPLVNDKHVLVYSCGVREGGSAHGKLLGAIGVIFDWDDLSGGVIANTPVAESELPLTDICIVNSEGRVLAGNRHRMLDDRIDFPGREALFKEPRNHALVDLRGKPAVIAHAQAPGYQGYTTGWHSLIIQRLEAA